MAASLLLLLDDITSVLDDVATITKVAAAKTAGVVGDDLALNAKQIAGVQADRELPVVWAVARGSAVNKLILVPIALAVSLLAPWAIVPLLMAGGAYLCYEGVEKILHALMPEAAHGHAGADDRSRAAAPPEGTTGEQARIAGVDVGADREQPAAHRPVAVGHRAVDQRLLREQGLQLAPQRDAFEQRARGIDARHAIAQRRVHMKVRIDKRRAEQLALRVDAFVRRGLQAGCDFHDTAVLHRDRHAAAAIGQGGVVDQ
jgi:hypothetical protein